MIMGIFGGHSLKSLHQRREQITKLETGFQDDLAVAAADRMAAIRQAQDELNEINKLTKKGS